jgi:hypothetical protein
MKDRTIPLPPFFIKADQNLLKGVPFNFCSYNLISGEKTPKTDHPCLWRRGLYEKLLKDKDLTLL